MTLVHTGSGSHLALSRSDLSNQMELAKHHIPASVLRGSGGVKREAGKGGVVGERCADG